jgi:hypothetical protein
MYLSKNESGRRLKGAEDACANRLEIVKARKASGPDDGDGIVPVAGDFRKLHTSPNDCPDNSGSW